MDLPAIGEQQNKALVAEIMIEELNSVISKFKANKTPGTDSYLSEWYKIFRPQITPMLLNYFNYISMSRFVWNSRRPRIRFKTLHLVKEKRGRALPCLQGYYYYAAQLKPLVCWCIPSYESKWKTLEISQIDTPI